MVACPGGMKYEMSLKKHFIILYDVLLWYDPLYVFNTFNRLSTLLKGQKATTMTRRIPHSQIYTFAVSLLKTLCRRSPVIGPWGLRAIERKIPSVSTPGQPWFFPHFHLMILSHVVHSDIQQHLETKHHRCWGIFCIFQAPLASLRNVRGDFGVSPGIQPWLPNPSTIVENTLVPPFRRWICRVPPVTLQGT